VLLYRYKSGNGRKNAADVANQAEMKELMAKRDAETEAMRDKRREATMDANQAKATKEEEMLARLDANHKEIKAKMDANQENWIHALYIPA
jgi:hypothetical protein